jgi:HSP20 family molecular chaperone IbpA
MFTKKYYNRINNTHYSRLNPIDAFIQNLLLNNRLTRDVFSKESIEKDYIINYNNSNLSKCEECYKYKTVATGLKQEDLEIYIEDSSLIIFTKKSVGENKFSDSFKSTINHKIKLKDKVDKDNITLILSNGILEVVVPFENF